VIGPHLEKVERLRAVAERLGVPVGRLALRVVADLPGVSGVIAGSRDERHVRENALAGDLELDDGTRREVDAIFRG
jgi:aryl-alcohol dehydrogenase-like predicted oxidoreductase